MAGGRQDQRGGILSLRRLLSDPEAAEAIQADLLARGLTLADLGTWKLSYWDLRCVIRWLPADAAYRRFLHPDEWQWTLPEHILAGIYDTLQGANWQRAGNKHAKRPDPLPRPGVKPKNEIKHHKPKQASKPDEVAKVLQLDFSRVREIAVEPESPKITDRTRRRLSDAVRSEIAARRAAGESAAALAEEYGVSRSTIYRAAG